MAKILKNNTGSPVPLPDTGVVVPASGQTTIDPAEYPIFAASSDTVTEVGNSVLTVNDGSVDLGISDGVDLIKGIFQKHRIIGDTDATLIGNVDDELKTTNRIRGGTDGALIGNSGDALKVSAIVFPDEEILVSPRPSHQAFLNLTYCTQKEILEQLRIMNQHMEVLTDVESMKDETENRD